MIKDNNRRADDAAMEDTKTKRRFSFRKAFRYGAASTLFTAIFLAGIVLLNIIFLVISNTINLKFDITPEKLFKISDDTYQLLDSLEEDVNIYILTPEAKFGDQNALQFLKQYDTYSDRINFQAVDINLNPSFIQKYKGVGYTSIIFETDTRYKVVNSADLYVKDQNTTARTGVKAEMKISSAINFVTADEVPVMANISGHDELGVTTSLFSDFIEMAKDNNFEVINLNLTTQAIPQDVKYINIIGPALDLSLEEIDKLDRFLDRGDVTIAIYLRYDTPDLPNLKEFMAEWGIEASPDIILEPESNRASRPYDLILQRGSADILSALSPTANILVPSSVVLGRLYESKGTTTVSELIKTSSKSYSKSLEAALTTSPDKAEGDKAGPFSAGIISTREASAGSYMTYSNMIVFGSFLMISNDCINDGSYINADIAANCFTTIIDDEDAFIVVPRYYISSTLNITAQQALFLCVVFAVVLVALLASALVVFLRRKHL